MHLAKPEIVKEERCFLVEGYTDVMAMHQAGVTNVVSSSGTALTTGQIHLIVATPSMSRSFLTATLQGFALRFEALTCCCRKACRSKSCSFLTVTIPTPTPRKLAAMRCTAHPRRCAGLPAIQSSIAFDEAGTDPLKRAEMIRSVVTSIAAIPDAIQRSVYLQSSATQLKMDETVLGHRGRQGVARAIQGCRQARGPNQSHGQPEATRRAATEPGSPSFEAPMPGVPPMEVVPHVSERAITENDLIRALIEYAADIVQVTVEGEDGAEPSTMEVPFAELVIHRLEEEEIAIKETVNQAVVKRFSEELDQERILTADQLANDQNVGLQQKVAGALVQQHVLSPNWSNRHKIYPVVERDQLTSLLEDSLRRLHLIDLREEAHDVQTKLEAGGLDLDEERTLLAQKVRLDRDIRETSAHFGTVILPKQP